MTHEKKKKRRSCTDHFLFRKVYFSAGRVVFTSSITVLRDIARV